jgi:hypothetical protein
MKKKTVNLFKDRKSKTILIEDLIEKDLDKM